VGDPRPSWQLSDLLGEGLARTPPFPARVLHLVPADREAFLAVGHVPRRGRTALPDRARHHTRLESTESIKGPRVSTRDPRAHKIVSFPLKFEEPPKVVGRGVGERPEWRVGVTKAKDLVCAGDAAAVGQSSLSPGWTIKHRSSAASHGRSDLNAV